MLKNLLVTLAIVWIALSGNCLAQNELMDLQHKVVNEAGINGYYSPDANGIYNPATLPEMGDYGFKSFAGASVGKTNLPTGTIDFITYGVSGKVTKNLFASLYLYNTTGNVTFNNAIPLAGSNLNAKVYSTELCFGYNVSKKLRVGAAIQNENGNSSLAFAGTPLASIRSSSDIDYRLGAQYRFDEKLKIGLVFANRIDNTNMTMHPAMSGLPTDLNFSGKYEITSWTPGIAYNPTQATQLFYSHRWNRYKNPSGAITRENFSYFGVQQYVTPEWNIKLAEWNNQPEASINFTNQKGWFGSLYYRKGADIPGFGASDTYFMTIGKYFGSEPQSEPEKPKVKKVAPSPNLVPDI